MRYAAVLLALLTPAPTMAQSSTTPPVAQAPAATPPDPARLDLARRLIDQIMPPANREQMIEAILAPMMANVSRTLTRDPKLSEMLGNNPRVKAIFDRFIERQTARSLANLRGELPAMAETMSRAYARNFEAAQLREIAAFFATPTGAIYLARSPAIMKDPDVLAWQSALIVKSLATIQGDVSDMLKELSAEAGRSQ